MKTTSLLLAVAALAGCATQTASTRPAPQAPGGIVAPEPMPHDLLVLADDYAECFVKVMAGAAHGAMIVLTGSGVVPDCDQ